MRVLAQEAFYSMVSANLCVQVVCILPMHEADAAHQCEYSFCMCDAVVRGSSRMLFLVSTAQSWIPPCQTCEAHPGNKRMQVSIESVHSNSRLLITTGKRERKSLGVAVVVCGGWGVGMEGTLCLPRCSCAPAPGRRFTHEGNLAHRRTTCHGVGRTHQNRGLSKQ